jgi:hypothetical protein
MLPPLSPRCGSADRAIPLLSELLTHKSGRTRLAAAEGLGKLGPKSRTALPLLIRMYQANDIQYVGASHWSLGQVIKRIDAGAAERLGVE